MARCRVALFASLLPLVGCSPNFSPKTYTAAAMQQANKVEQGIVVGVRRVDVSVAGTTGAVAGGAAGGIVGAQLPGSNTTAALGTVGGGLLGGLLGAGVEKATGDTQGYEYIVRKPNGDLVSVTQVDKVPMALGEHVLVIAGIQARIVPDYTTAPPENLAGAAKAALKEPVVKEPITAGPAISVEQMPIPQEPLKPIGPAVPESGSVPGIPITP